MKYVRLHLLCFSLLSYTLVIGQAGSLDLSFSGNGKQRILAGNFLDDGYCLALQADQKILIGGDYEQDQQYGGGYSAAVIRLNSDGTLDNNFANGGKLTFIFGGAQADIASIAVQADGKIILAGSYYYNFTVSLFLARLTTDGLIDNSFNNGMVFLSGNRGKDVVIQPDGKIVVACEYFVPGSQVNKTDFSLVRYNTNGSLDNSFGSNGQIFTDVGGDDQVTGLLLQNDGKILLTGTRDDDYIVTVRYTTAGGLDYSFGSGTAKSYVTVGDGQECYSGRTALQPDGKILISGGYTTTAYANNFLIIRLNSNGSLDNTFAGNGKKGINFNGFDFGESIAVQSNGKIVVIGNTGYLNSNQAYQFAICRLNGTDGSLDNNFGNAGKVLTGWTNINAYANDVAIQQNGRIVVAGTSGVDFGAMRFLASGSNLTNADMLGVQQNQLPEPVPAIHIYPNPAGNILHVSGLATDAATIITMMDISGKTLIIKKSGAQSNCDFDVSKLIPGTYLLMITGSNKQQTFPFIKIR